jgi:tetratricopeptide (TPR) repeat protein
MSPRRRARFERTAGYTGSLAVVTGVSAQIAREVAANELGVLGDWVPFAVIAAGALVSLAPWLLRLLPSPPPVPPQPEGLPRVDELVGRDLVVETVVARAHGHGTVVVHGPLGIGTSSVAVTAARRLVQDTASQRYVDLSKLRPNGTGLARIPLLRDRNRWVRMPVLRTLGLDLRMSGVDATQAVVKTLRDSGLVLVIDNVEDVNEVRWIAQGVPGAFIIIAGTMNTDELTGVADVAVQGVEPEDALLLLCRQDAEPPRTLTRVLRNWMRGRGRHFDAERNSIVARVHAEPVAARELAEHYPLGHPRVAILLGRWLAQNPGETFAGLLHALKHGGEVFELQAIMGRVLAGTSGGARRLLAQLVAAPDAEFPDPAVAALGGISVEEADLHLAELSRRFLVQRSSSGSRVTRSAASLAEPVHPREAARVHARLATFYADLARVNAELLGGDHDTDATRWFGVHDVTLLALLGVPKPPRRAAAHLWEIGDALDRWFLREQRDRERTEVAEAMLARATETGEVTAQAVAYLRMASAARSSGDVDEAQRLLARAEALGRGRMPCFVQLKTEWAVCHVDNGDLDAARNDLRLAHRALPKRDREGRMINLIDLGAIEIMAERYDMAEEILGRAVALAQEIGAVAYQAYARELTGIALYRQNHIGAAEDAWSDAEILYRSLGDETGRARCEGYRDRVDR